MFKDSKQQVKTYKSIFRDNPNGKDILEDLRTAFCISPIINLGYTGKPEIDLAIREGLRMAYQYIESNLIDEEEKNGK